MAQNTDKTRKGEAQERMEEAENAGRFAGDDTDSRQARQQAEQSIKSDPVSRDYERKDEIKQNRQSQMEATDAEAHRNPAGSQDSKGEAQNVNDDTGRPMTEEEELQHARNKASEGRRQNRDDS